MISQSPRGLILGSKSHSVNHTWLMIGLDVTATVPHLTTPRYPYPWTLSGNKAKEARVWHRLDLEREPCTWHVRGDLLREVSGGESLKTRISKSCNLMPIWGNLPCLNNKEFSPSCRSMTRLSWLCMWPRRRAEAKRSESTAIKRRGLFCEDFFFEPPSVRFPLTPALCS